MIGYILGGLILMAVVWWWLRRRRRANATPPGPLAGYDTGVRSPWRVPGSSFWGPRRGF